jgi:hypothetical protein
MAGAALTWLGDDFLAALGEVLLDADLGAPGVTGAVVIAAPAQVGRPRRGSRSAPAPASDAPAEGRGTLELRDGRVVGWRPGEVAGDAVATLTLPAADARAVLDGTVEPSVLFMQGRLKIDGDMAVVLAILSATTRGGYDRARATLEGRLGP